MPSSAAEVFDGKQCYMRVKQCIDANDLGGAERILRTNVNRYPRQASLRHYHTVVSSAQAQIVLQDDSSGKGQRQKEMTLGWLRLIAADRVSDRIGYLRELERLSTEFSDSVVTQLLQAGGDENVRCETERVGASGDDADRQ